MKTGYPILVLSLGFLMVISRFTPAEAHLPPVSSTHPAAARAVVLAGAAANADVAQGAEMFVAAMSEQALAFLADSTISKDQKTERFRNLLESSFDMKTISRFALGRYWRLATPEQRREYQDLFHDMILRIYSEKFNEYKGQSFVTRGVRLAGKRDAIVTSFVVPEQGPEIQVDWRVRYKKGQYRIVDIVVEGVSMTVTQRSDFASVIQRGGGDITVLLEHLRGQ